MTRAGKTALAVAIMAAGVLAISSTNSKAGAPTVGIGSAASFISGMQSYLKEAGPRYNVIGVCWFDTDTDTNNHNWRVDQTAQSWQAWLTLSRDPYFGGHGS